MLNCNLHHPLAHPCRATSPGFHVQLIPRGAHAHTEHEISKTCLCQSSQAANVQQAVARVSAGLSQKLPVGVVAAGLTAGVAPSALAGTVLPAGNAVAQQAAAAAATAADGMPVDLSTYVPGPVEVGWQIWFAAVVSTIPFIIGAYEFGKRILIQRRCEVCEGSGLVMRGSYPKKCTACGGFFPWISWQMFLSANAQPGNGGPLLQPKGQTSVFYQVPPARPDKVEQEKQPPLQQMDAEDNLRTVSTGFQLPALKDKIKGNFDEDRH